MSLKDLFKIAARIALKPLQTYCITASSRASGGGYTNYQLLTKIVYYRKFGKALNLKDPKDLNEKIQWLKLNSNTSQWSRLSDKYAAREYVRECDCSENLVDLYGKWDNASEIDFDALPHSFVLKSNHGCGGNLLVEDKSTLDIESSVAKLNGWLSKSYGKKHAEFHYLDIKPCIIAEELLHNNSADYEHSTSLIDYKVWCFNGKPHYIFVCTNRTHGSIDLVVYDLDWRVQEGALNSTSHFKIGKSIPRPDALSEMLKVAEKLAKPFPQVRADFYIVDNKVYFGEMTFTSAAGMMNYFTDEFLLHLGGLIDLKYK